MTKAFLFLPLLILGCASKPKPPLPVMDASAWNTITGNVFVHHELPPEGVTWHVSREQWQAAQGLYMWDIETYGKGYKVVDWDYLVTKVFKCRYEGRPVDCHGVMHADQGKIIVDEGEVSMMDTFPPGGDVK